MAQESLLRIIVYICFVAESILNRPRWANGYALALSLITTISKDPGSTPGRGIFFVDVVYTFILVHFSFKYS